MEFSYLYKVYKIFVGRCIVCMCWLYCFFWFQPHGFFNCSPAVDVPPSTCEMDVKENDVKDNGVTKPSLPVLIAKLWRDTNLVSLTLTVICSWNPKCAGTVIFVFLLRDYLLVGNNLIFSSVFLGLVICWHTIWLKILLLMVVLKLMYLPCALNFWISEWWYISYKE